MKNRNFLINYKSKILKGFMLYFLRLHRTSHSNSSLYHIVVTNSSNRIVSYLGYINFQEAYFKTSYKSLIPETMSGKFISLDFGAVADWLAKGAIPTPFLSMLFYEFGLLKSIDFKGYKTEQSFRASVERKISQIDRSLFTTDSQNLNIDKLVKEQEFCFSYLNFKTTKFTQDLLLLDTFDSVVDHFSSLKKLPQNHPLLQNSKENDNNSFLFDSNNNVTDSNKIGEFDLDVTNKIDDDEEK